MSSRISEQLIHGVETEEDWIRAWDASSYSRRVSVIEIMPRGRRSKERLYLAGVVIDDRKLRNRYSGLLLNFEDEISVSWGEL